MSLNIGMSFQLQEAVLPNGLYRVYGEAIHPMRTFHPNEYPAVRVYLEEELVKAAESLTGKPFVMDHKTALPSPNKVTSCWWDATRQTVAYEGEVEPYVARWIREGDIKGVSIELDWAIPGGSIAYVDGFAAKGFKFTGLTLVRTLEPGDKEAFIKLREAVIMNKPLPEEEKPAPLEKSSLTLRQKIKKRAGI